MFFNHEIYSQQNNLTNHELIPTHTFIRLDNITTAFDINLMGVIAKTRSLLMAVVVVDILFCSIEGRRI